MKTFVIISPHPDDELIGCYTLFKRGLVRAVWYGETDEERMKNAERFGKEWGFEILYGKQLSFYQKFIIKEVYPKNCVYLFPDTNEKHPLHRFLSSVAQQSSYKIGYYSTDMNASYIRELSKKDQQAKRAMLDKYYPDQKSLWENDWRYFLFEGICYDLLSSAFTS